MCKKTVFAFGVYLLSFVANAQTDGIARVLREVEQNNKELKAYSDLMVSRSLELKSTNNLPDPQAGFFYLPWGEHTSGDYTEFQFTQSFEFPTVYRTRNELIAKELESMQLDFGAMKQKVLLLAKRHCVELTYMNKRLAVEQSRVQQAQQVFEQIEELFGKEQVSILEVNKAKVVWIQEQFKVEQLENDIRNVLHELQNLNGGVELNFTQTEFVESLDLNSLDSIWQEKESIDPNILSLKQRETVALQHVKLYRNSSLPNLTAGFNSQGISGERFSGVYGGISIPLWNNKSKVKAADAYYQYRRSYTSALSLVAFTDFQKQYNDYQVLLSKYNEYQDTISGINSDALLLQAYELGEISFLEYYMELQFYQKADDSMLEMEKQLYWLKAEILKHRL
ncbi:MAG: TolC family protein [Bacteroidota bacterium]